MFDRDKFYIDSILEAIEKIFAYSATYLNANN